MVSLIDPGSLDCKANNLLDEFDDIKESAPKAYRTRREIGKDTRHHTSFFIDFGMIESYGVGP
jgi:hypothetical protein